MIDYAKRELSRAGFDEESLKDETNKMMYDNILEIIQVFSNQNHSGFSAGYIIPRVHQLLQFRPIVPYKGDADEFDPETDQHKGISSLFRDPKTGMTMQCDAFVYKDKDGCCYTNRNSRRYFRKLPKTMDGLEHRYFAAKWAPFVGAFERMKRRMIMVF